MHETLLPELKLQIGLTIGFLVSGTHFIPAVPISQHTIRKFNHNREKQGGFGMYTSVAAAPVLAFVIHIFLIEHILFFNIPPVKSLIPVSMTMLSSAAYHFVLFCSLCYL